MMNMIKTKNEIMTIDASGIYYRDINARLRGIAGEGIDRIKINNVYGQRYIGTGIRLPVEIDIYGTAGNDLGAFLDGPKITVHGHAQDGCGNTMNSGEIIIHGHAGDVVGLSARGGNIFVRDSVGYRAGIHMKEYQDKKPALVIGGSAQDFLGEYMAGGIIILLGLNLSNGQYHPAGYVGTGMHGGVIYLRGKIEERKLGKEVDISPVEEYDLDIIRNYVEEYAIHFGCRAEEIMDSDFCKLSPRALRPYGKLYA
jgi:glutamate synthase domain-containing protein 3